MNKISVVIADDHELFREGTRNLIEKEKDIEVVGEVGDGKKAIELVARLRPNVVLMDIAMPVVNGIEATRQIKASQPSTAVLILTAYDNDQYIVALLEAGAAGYLLKNVSGKELVNAIRSVFAGEAVLHPAIARKVFSHFGPATPEQSTVSGDKEVSEREMEILILAAKGMSNQDIADRLFVSRRTVQAHLGNVFRKMDVGSRTEAVLQAIKRGWLSMDDLV
jgi:NarL family two-component system response regulator LiaR